MITRIPEQRTIVANDLHRAKPAAAEARQSAARNDVVSGHQVLEPPDQCIHALRPTWHPTRIPDEAVVYNEHGESS
jgi:hypothetical protein